MVGRYLPHSALALHQNRKSSPSLADTILHCRESVRWMHRMGHSFQDWIQCMKSNGILVDMSLRCKPTETVRLLWVHSTRVPHRSSPLRHWILFGGCMFLQHRGSVSLSRLTGHNIQRQLRGSTACQYLAGTFRHYMLSEWLIRWMRHNVLYRIRGIGIAPNSVGNDPQYMESGSTSHCRGLSYLDLLLGNPIRHLRTLQGCTSLRGKEWGRWPRCNPRSAPLGSQGS